MLVGKWDDLRRYENSQVVGEVFAWLRWVALRSSGQRAPSGCTPSARLVHPLNGLNVMVPLTLPSDSP